MVDVLSFRPTLEEKTLLDRKNIRWSEFCRKNIQELMIHTKQDLYDKIIIRVACILLGCLIFLFSYLLNDIILIICNYVIAATMAITGTAGIILLRRDKKRLMT